MKTGYTSFNIEYCRSGSGKRLANYLIDLLLFYFIEVFWLTLIDFFWPGNLMKMTTDPFARALIRLFFYSLLMFGMEMAFRGKSLGKMITGTRAVDQNGHNLTLKQFLFRSFIRVIPFNALTALGNPCSPWHDSLSVTFVVDEKKLDLAKRQDEFYIQLQK